MNGDKDSFGDLLREFYNVFGVQDEIPPAGINVTKLMGQNAVPEEDILILRSALGDSKLRTQFGKCKKILEELATRLSQEGFKEELLCELNSLNPPTDQEFDQLANGIFWFAQTGSLDGKLITSATNEFEEAMKDIPLQLQLRMAKQGSLVLRLYVALVFMQEGILRKFIEQGANNCKPHCGLIRKLLNTDYIRRIRNALSHGTFTTTIAGIAFQDQGCIVATPGFLNWLCTWLMIVQLQVCAASKTK